MRRERVADDIYVFISERYAQVAMGVITTEEGAIVIDSSPFPSETKEVVDFISSRVPQGVRYVINTHHHADHTYGNYLFPEAEIIAHRGCREAMAQAGAQALDRAKAENPELAEIELRLPDITFDKELFIHLGARQLRLIHTPSHTPDTIIVMVEGDKILFTGDLVMPVPYIVYGDPDQFRAALDFVQELKPENIVQGHGDILLRGELRQDLQDSICYLDNIRDKARELVEKGASPRELAAIDIESCGKSRIPLDGLVKQLHQANLAFLYKKYKAQKQSGR
ncbi:MAG: MBL fold metallo-hydrolase [Chloroflexi bacterium]|nr:MBL fold metallo-hydrolase [Chloroflexota bacterium]